MATLIEANPPERWQDLESRVAQILSECGYEVEIQRNVKLARGDVNIDVWADDHSSPSNIIAVECKHWSTAATKNVVHGFRTVVGDSGANTGLLVSSAGFQDGAVEAAAYSNVRLLDWDGFQEMFATRWFREHMCPRIAEETDPLHEYTEPINSRIFRKANALPEAQQERFESLRTQHFPLAATNFLFHPVVIGFVRPGEPVTAPPLPLRENAYINNADVMLREVPGDVVNVTALRPLMDALIAHSHRAIAEFDAVFGERA